MTDTENDGRKTNAELSKEVAQLTTIVEGLRTRIGEYVDSQNEKFAKLESDLKAAHAEIASIKDNPDNTPAVDLFRDAGTAHLLAWAEKVLRKYHHNDEPAMVDDGSNVDN